MTRRWARLWKLILIVLLFVGFWNFENNTIVTETYTLCSDRLPEAFDGFRVVELADLHGREFGAGNWRLLEAVREAEPDIIALDGDLADDGTNLEVIRTLAVALAEIAPVYYVTGNHEWAMEQRTKLFTLLEKAGVVLLHNQYCLLQKGEDTLVVAGVDDPNGPWDQKTPETLTAEIREACGDPYILLLAHRNDQLNRWASLKLDVVLTGHAHGGVVRLPWLGGIFGPGRQLFPEYSAGLYQKGRTTMLVSRGLGNTVAPIRLFNRPHLPVLVLRTGANP